MKAFLILSTIIALALSSCAAPKTENPPTIISLGFTTYARAATRTIQYTAPSLPKKITYSLELIEGHLILSDLTISGCRDKTGQKRKVILGKDFFSKIPHSFYSMSVTSTTQNSKSCNIADLIVNIMSGDLSSTIDSPTIKLHTLNFKLSDILANK